MSKSNSVSILLPVFNCEPYIEKAINSLINSTFKNFEIVFINDGSTDNTLQLVKKINDKRIKIYNKGNSGLIETLNFGLQKCKYHIVMRMDGDDIIDKYKIEKQLSYLLKSESILVGTQGKLINSDGIKKRDINLPINHDEIVKSLLKFSPGLIHPSVMFYKDALIKIGGYNQNFKHAEDYEMYLRLIKVGKLSNLNEKLIYLRKHDTNVSSINSKEQIKNSIISREIFLDSVTSKIDRKLYLIYKEKTEKKNIYKLFVKVQTTIVYMQSNSRMQNLILIIILKLFRRFLKYFI